MSNEAQFVVAASKSLQRVEDLLDRAIDDLAAKEQSVPGSQSPVILAEVCTELQAVWALVQQRQLEFATLLPQVRSLLPRLSSAERLLAGAAEFYRGWCAAAPPASYPAPGYRVDEGFHGPALLLLEG